MEVPRVADLMPEAAVTALIDHAVQLGASDLFFASNENHVAVALRHLGLIRMSETAAPGARYRIGAYRFWHRHVAVLLAAADPALDADATAHLVLATLSAEVLSGIAESRIGRRRARACAVELVRRLAIP